VLIIHIGNIILIYPLNLWSVTTLLAWILLEVTKILYKLTHLWYFYADKYWYGKPKDWWYKFL